jgi:hypothetical protein
MKLDKKFGKKKDLEIEQKILDEIKRLEKKRK